MQMILMPKLMLQHLSFVVPAAIIEQFAAQKSWQAHFSLGNVIISRWAAAVV
jgi:hypothetical protein